MRDFEFADVQLRWPQFLQQNHPGYRNIEISSDRLQNLPDNSSVINQILTQSTDPCPDSSTETDIAEDIDDTGRSGQTHTLLNAGYSPYS